jgi:hypothetical protein
MHEGRYTNGNQKQNTATSYGQLSMRASFVGFIYNVVLICYAKINKHKNKKQSNDKKVGHL